MADDAPFTLAGHPVADAMAAGALPPKRALAGSPANYWQIDEAIISNMQLVVTPLDPSVSILKGPHCVVQGVVQKINSETDGDSHIWLEYPDGKGRLACEVTPQQKITLPKVGDHVWVYGILRYDLEHGWWEIHPVDGIEPV